MAVLVLDGARLYLESSVLADWFLIRTVKSDVLKAALERVVSPSHEVTEHFLTRRTGMRCYTSEWAIAESVSVIRRSRIELSLFLDGVPLRLYDRLKDTPRYSLSQSQIEQIEEELSDFRKRAGKEKGIKILPSLTNEMAIRGFLTRFGLEVADAFHLALAKRSRCTVFVTRDNDFLRKKKRLEGTIRIVTPAHILTVIRGRRGKDLDSMQEGEQGRIVEPA